ncbi:hypothetical protein [Brucella melitensis]|uniref:hypothetical protein n=1 Tax=Brucella melitensis TaxID=29459 RepID=UPI001AA0596E|nr:hypothetical protein [Brucella melitensis]
MTAVDATVMAAINAQSIIIFDHSENFELFGPIGFRKPKPKGFAFRFGAGKKKNPK